MTGTPYGLVLRVVLGADDEVVGVAEVLVLGVVLLGVVLVGVVLSFALTRVRLPPSEPVDAVADGSAVTVTVTTLVVSSASLAAVPDPDAGSDDAVSGGGTAPPVSDAPVDDGVGPPELDSAESGELRSEMLLAVPGVGGGAAC